MKRLFAATLVAGGMFAGFVSIASAASLTTNPGSWGAVVTFGAFEYANETAITDQFAAEGVTFDGSSALRYFTLTPDTLSWGGVTQGILFNPAIPAQDTGFEDLIMDFTSPVSAAGFNLRAADATLAPTMEFSAYLGLTLIESFQSVVPLTNDATPEQFYGFEGFIFDRIVISMLDPVLGAPCCGANLDNVSFNVAPVPLPAGVWLLLSALGGLGFAGWRRRKAVAA